MSVRTENQEDDGQELLRRSLGTVVEVLRGDNQLFFVGRVTSFDPVEQELRVDLHRGRETPQGVLYGSSVKIQLHVKGGWSELLTIYGKVVISAPDHWRIRVEHTVACKESREAFRQRIRLVGHLTPAGEERALPCQMEDISVTGVGFYAGAELEEGERFTLSLPPLTAGGRAYELLCRVVARSERADGRRRYGCAFEHLNQQTEGRLFKEILRLQAKGMSR